MTPSRPMLRIVHLFPDLLNVYGDRGNVRALVARSEGRGIRTDVVEMAFAARTVPPGDVYLIGGGQDREQVTVARELERLGNELRGHLADGAAILAVCGGYQNLGRLIRGPEGDLPGPGILPVWTDVRPSGQRLVGPIVVFAPAAVAALGRPGALAAGVPGAERTLVGFENHAGRTFIDRCGAPLGRLEHGFGNNGRDAREGVIVTDGDVRLPSRVGTYLHGPILPRNPHLADSLIACGIARGHAIPELRPLDDRAEWQAHEQFAAALRRRADAERRMPRWAHKVVDPLRSLVGF
jgi:CobQ-like glutamine amidotransferase family enzyme